MVWVRLQINNRSWEFGIQNRGNYITYFKTTTQVNSMHEKGGRRKERKGGRNRYEYRLEGVEENCRKFESIASHRYLYSRAYIALGYKYPGLCKKSICWCGFWILILAIKGECNILKFKGECDRSLHVEVLIIRQTYSVLALRNF